jgi:hypothetical protein
VAFAGISFGEAQNTSINTSKKLVYKPILKDTCGQRKRPKASILLAFGLFWI